MNWLTYTNRYEIKYVVETARLPEIKRGLAEFLTPDRNGGDTEGYFNYSIYFDSPSYHFYREKQEGDLVRIKPRIRLYRSAMDAPASAMFLELKGRYNRIVTKRRTPVDLGLAEDLLSSGPFELNGYPAEASALGEFTYLNHRFRLAPCVTVAYHRTAFYGAFYPDVRVTFDRELLCSRATTLDNPADSFLPALPANRMVIELKYNNKAPRMLLGRFNSLGLQQTTFSKYATSLERSHDFMLADRALVA